MNEEGFFVGWLDALYAVVLLLLFGYIAYRVLRWLISRQYSVQRFAFRALGVLSAGFLALVALYTVGPIPIQLLRWAVSDAEFRIEAPSISLPELALLVLAYGILATVLFLLHLQLARNEQRPPAESAQGIQTPGLAEAPAAWAGQRISARPVRLGHVLARHLIMADDRNYGLPDLSSLTLDSVARDQSEGWHPEIHAFLGTYGVAEEPYIYFYYDNAKSFLQERAVECWRQRYPERRPSLIVEKATAEERTEIEKAGVRTRTFADVCSRPDHLLIYKKWLSRRLDEPAAGGIGPIISDCYVPLAAELRDGESVVAVPEVISWLLDWVGREDTPEQISLLGEYGQGKSIIALKFAKELLDQFDKYGRIPILIELGGKSPRNISPEDLVRMWGQRFSIDPNLAQYWVEEGRAVLVFDAFDEMDLVGDKNVVEQHFHALWRFAEGYRPKVIITGRSNLFLDEDEIARALRARGHRGQAGEYSRLLYLRKLDRPRIEKALRAWPRETAAGILQIYDEVGEESEFQDLVSRPSMLTQAAAIWPQIQDRIDKQTALTAFVMRTFLYDTFKRKRIARQGRSAHGEVATPVLTLGELSFFMRAIALWMAQNTGQTNRIQRQEVDRHVRRLLAVFPQSLPKNLDPTFDDLPETRTDSYLPRYLEGHRDYGSSIVVREVATTGVLVEDPADSTMFQMAHKSFFDYLVAECFVLYKYSTYFSSSNEIQTYITTNKVN